MAGLQYKNQVDIVAGGYNGEWKGSTGVITNWTDVPGTSGTMTCNYYYHDSWFANNAVSSRVIVTVSDSWEIIETTYDNHIKLRVTSSITRIERVASGSGAEGSWNCLGYSWPLFHIMVYTNREKTNLIWQANNLSSTINQVISSSPISLGTFEIDLAPQSSATPTSRGTVFYQSSVVGHENDGDGSSYVDRMWMGINFRNTLPNDYRPGKVLDGNGVWQSHNRQHGAANIRNASGYQTMRTANGASASDNPPLIRHSSGMKNMRKIGNNA